VYALFIQQSCFVACFLAKPLLAFIICGENNSITCLQSIIGWWHQKAGVAEEVANMGPAIVSATVDIYQAIKRDLLPTPAKNHYTYNMRDLSKVFQGIAMVGVGVDTPEKMTRCASLPVKFCSHAQLNSYRAESRCCVPEPVCWRA